jgi:excinuclease ABC subunit B
LRDQIIELKSGTGLLKIEPKSKPGKYGKGKFGGGRRPKARA